MSEEKDSNKNSPEKNSRSNNNKHNTGKKKASETVVFYDKDSLSNESQTTSAAASRDNKPEKQHMKKINMDYSSKKAGKLPKYRVVLNVVLSIIAGLLILVGAGLFVVYTDFHRINYEEIDADPVKDVTFTMPEDAPKNAKVEVLFENRSIALKDGVFSDSYPAHFRHIYKITR